MNDTIFYIILGVIYLIITALGRIAKKKQQEQPRNEEPWSVEDALRDLQSSSDTRSETIHPDWSQTESSFPTATLPSTPERTDHVGRTGKTRAPASRSIIKHLKDPKSAQTAIILREILGKPKGTRGFPRPFLHR